MRAVAEIEEGQARRTRIVVTEMPYQTSVAKSILTKIEELVDAGELDGIPTPTTTRPRARPGW